MRDCICCQCREDFSRIEYFQCESCNRYGTKDEYPSDSLGEMCWACRERDEEEKRQAKWDYHVNQKIAERRGK